jgi:hypothetical protein
MMMISTLSSAVMISTLHKSYDFNIHKTIYLEGVNEVVIQIPHTPPVPERTY